MNDPRSIRVLWIVLHGLVLAIVNLSSILMGYVVYFFLKDFKQISVQVPFAFILSIMVFLLWSALIRHLRPEKAIPRNFISYILILVASFIWIPVIFYPLHYFTQHYLSSIKNILWVWVFQLPTNTIIILLTYFIFKKLYKKTSDI